MGAGGRRGRSASLAAFGARRYVAGIRPADRVSNRARKSDATRGKAGARPRSAARAQSRASSWRLAAAGRSIRDSGCGRDLSARALGPDTRNISRSLGRRWATQRMVRPGVYGPLIMGGAIVAGLSLITYAVLREARVIRIPGHPTSHGRDFPHQVGCFLSAMEYFLAIMLSCVAVMPLLGPPNIALVLIGSIALIVVVLAAAHHLNQVQACEIELSVFQTDTTIFGDGTLDEHWKMGLFYYNPDDPALLVEKRFGIGYTMNFARPVAWVVLALVAVIPVALAFAAVVRHG